TRRRRQSHGGDRGAAAAAADHHRSGGRRRPRATRCGARRRGGWLMKRAPVRLRSADAADAKKLHAIITANLEEGHLLPRTLSELTVRAGRFVVATRGRKLIGCAELAPLSAQVAEVRSLAVDKDARGGRVGVMIVDELRRRARREGFEKLCAFTHVPSYFINMGFSIVPHLWLTEKIYTDCVKCPHFRQCGQYAMVVPLDSAFDAERGYGLPAARAAAVFTTNLAVAAPVVVSRDHLARSAGAARAVVVNSGCANACTGDDGLEVARAMASETAALVGCPAEQVLVASTG